MSWHSNFVKLSPRMLLPPFIFLLFFITYGECLFPIQFRQVAKNSTETTWVRSFGWWKSEQSWANKKTWRFHHKSFWWSRVNRWTYTFKGTWLCFNWSRCDILVHQTVSFIRFLHAILSQMKKKEEICLQTAAFDWKSAERVEENASQWSRYQFENWFFEESELCHSWMVGWFTRW